MNTDMVTTVVIETKEIWGPEKTSELLALGVFGASLFIVLGMFLIPNQTIIVESKGE